jgi:hypothetical protein
VGFRNPITTATPYVDTANLNAQRVVINPTGGSQGGGAVLLFPKGITSGQPGILEATEAPPSNGFWPVDSVTLTSPDTHTGGPRAALTLNTNNDNTGGAGAYLYAGGRVDVDTAGQGMTVDYRPVPRGQLGRADLSGGAGASGAFAGLGQTASLAVAAGRRLQHAVNVAFYGGGNSQGLTVRVVRYVNGVGTTIFTRGPITVGGGPAIDGRTINITFDEVSPGGTFAYVVDAASSIAAGAGVTIAYVAYGGANYTVTDVGT